MKVDELTRYIAKAPSIPGVYFWRDSRKKPIYIGKAANLKSRISSYRKATDPRIRIMVEQAAGIDWHVLDTDIEALIEESKLIKRWRPKFNIAMRDDKQYFYVGFTKEQFPRIFLTHQPADDDAIGPFTDGAPLKMTLRALRRIFPYCTCKQKHHVRCLNAHIGKCPGYCCLRQESSKSDTMSYKKNIRAIRDVLAGKRENIIRRLHLPAVHRVFENARIISRMQYATLGLSAIPRRIEGYDIANISGQHAAGAMVVFAGGQAARAQYRLFNIKDGIEGDVPMLRQVMERRLAHREWPLPDLVIVDGGKAQLNAAIAAFGDIPVIAITKDDRHRAERLWSSLLPASHPLSTLPRPVCVLVVRVDGEAHRFAISHYRRRHRRAIAQ